MTLGLALRAEAWLPRCLGPPPPRAMATEAPAEAMDTTDIFGDGDAGEDLGEEIARAEPDEIAQRTRMLENEIKVLRNESSRLLHEQQTQKEKIKENGEKIKLNKQLPFLVANVVELLDMDAEEEPEEVRLRARCWRGCYTGRDRRRACPLLRRAGGERAA